jgi:hypothetical protein
MAQRIFSSSVARVLTHATLPASSTCLAMRTLNRANGFNV